MPQLSKHGVQDIVEKTVGAMSVAEQLRSVRAAAPYREKDMRCAATRNCQGHAEREESRTRAVHLVPAKPRWGDDARLAPATFWSLSN